MDFSTWQSVYTFYEDEKRVDMIDINVRRRRYELLTDVESWRVCETDEFGDYYEPVAVSREIFDIIVAGVKAKGYVRLVPEEKAD